MDIKIGADPEVFLADADGKLISAYGVIPGTKKAPHKVDRGAVQVDGMALEFNINPAMDAETFSYNITIVMDQLKAMIGEGRTIAITPTAHFGNGYINSQPLEARDLGCDPDFNAYSGTENPRPNVDSPIRTASGHIHVGWTKNEDISDPEHVEACRMLTKQLDLYLAPASRLWDTDDERRTLYGNLGAFRPKPYGCEYRVLSNAWLRHPETIGYVFSTTKKAVRALLDGKRHYEAWPVESYFNSNSPDDWYNVHTNFGATGYADWFYKMLIARRAEKSKERKSKKDMNGVAGPAHVLEVDLADDINIGHDEWDVDLVGQARNALDAAPVPQLEVINWQPAEQRRRQVPR